MDPSDGPQQSRQAFLSVLLAGLASVFFLGVLIFISNGFFLYVLLLGMAGYGSLHYLLWGRLMSEQVAGEREEEQLRQRALADDWPLPGTPVAPGRPADPGRG